MTSAGPKKIREIKVAVSSHLITRAEAMAFAEQAVALGEKISKSPESRNAKAVGDQIAFLVLGALAVELYLKSFMVVARGGRVTTGHDLSALYSQFPNFLKMEFESGYSRRVSEKPTNYVVTAIRSAKVAPNVPQGSGPSYRFVTFEDTVNSLATAFVAYRYFFENLGSKDWAYLPFPHQAVVSALASIEETYVNFERGKYRGKGDGKSAETKTVKSP